MEKTKRRGGNTAWVIGGLILVLVIAAVISLNINPSKDNAKNNSASAKMMSEAYAPNFSALTYRGNQISLDQYRGKKIVLTFWALTCPSCKLELPQLDKLAQTNSAVVITVVAATPGQLREYFKKHSYFNGRDPNFIVALDPNYKLFAMYHVRVTPTTYIIDGRGRIRKVLYGAVSMEYFKAYLNNI